MIIKEGMKMEENYDLEKEYTVQPDLFEKAYRTYQKKFVYPKSYLFMGLFLFLAADFVYAAVKQPDNTIVYLLIVICLAFAFREWHTPRFARMRIVETVRDMGNPVYKIGIGGGFIDIFTVDDGTEEEEEPDEETDDDVSEAPGLPEKTRINTNENYRLLEYEEFFLLLQDRKIFYILPKTGFSEDELEIVRKTNADINK